MNSFFDTGRRTIRLADNSSEDPFRGTNGAITTFQSIASRPDLWVPLSEKYKIILILDEMDYLTDSSGWGTVIKQIYDNSWIRISMTGSIFRNDGLKIFPFPYDGDKIDFSDNEKRRWVIYDSKQALSDGNIVPFDSYLVDGSGSYRDLSGIERRYQSLSGKRDELLSSFYTEYAYQVFSVSLKHFMEYKKDQPYAKYLVIANDIDIAKKYSDWFKDKGLKFEVATSEDTPQARRVLKRLKKPNIMPDALEGVVSVSMVFRGFNVPQATFLVYLSGIRSASYCIQAFGRIQRTYDDKERGFLYAPADPRLKKVLEIIDAGRILKADGQPQNKQKKKPEEEEDNRPAKKIEAIQSEAHIQDFSEIDFSKENHIEEIPQSEQEKNLRDDINHIVRSTVNKHSAGARKTKERILWMKVKQIVNNGRDESGMLIRKKLSEMSLSELSKVKDYLYSVYK
jgi:superfamily II DNA or RNA helicase